MHSQEDTLTSILARYDYPFLESLIAHEPVFPRDHSKLLTIHRSTGVLGEYHFYDLPTLLTANDVLVINETKVFAARLLGRKASGGKVELLLIKQVASNRFEAISKPGLKLGQQLIFPRRNLLEKDAFLLDELSSMDHLHAVVCQRDEQSAKLVVEFNRNGVALLQEIDQCGFTPLPPYIEANQSEEQLKSEYQTVYAKNLGSAAAPTAGLHFTDELLSKLEAKGVQIERITLHVGLGTFAKLTTEHINSKTLHSEYYEISQAVADRINQARQAGKRIIAVGTTSARSLESAMHDGLLQARAEETKIFIDPPYKFQCVDALLTNFHLPKSSLLMLVSALVSAPNTDHNFSDFLQTSVGKAYLHAIDHHYRFFSFGDACFIY